jgi:hypothetical protein
MSHASSARASIIRLAVALSLITLVLAHQLVYLATYGAQAGAALASTGHDLGWSLTVISVALLAIGLTGVAVGELLRLSRRARPAAGLVVEPRISGVRHLARDLSALWAPTFLMAAVLFVLLENGERLAAGLPAPGLSVLGASSYHDPLLIFELVSGVVALVAALYRWRRDVLVALICALRRRWPRSHATSLPPFLETVAQPSSFALRPPGRAPPLLLAD